MVDTNGIAAALSRAADAGDVPGVVAAAATSDGPIFEGGFGKRWIASMTKAVTGACAMQLVERRKLSLDAPIKSVLPQLATPKVLEGFDAHDNPKLRPARRDITLRHLLTHTSGYVYDMSNADMGRYQEKTGTPGIISCMNAALTTPLMADPGERWEYGISIDWAGQAVEAVSGQKLGTYMKENLFDPLGMKDTGFKISEAQRKRLAKIHARTPDGLISTDTEIPQEPEFEMGGAGLYSTVGDYLKFGEIETRIAAHDASTSEPSLSPVHVAALAADLKAVWSAPPTDARLKKRIVRTVIREVVADIDDEASEIVLLTHWIGGVHTELGLPRRRRGQRNSLSTDMLAAVRQLVLIANDDLIAGILNRNGLVTGHGDRWTRERGQRAQVAS
jgi:CubicO group peptidase (beta-lactamase class C family)